MTGLAQGTLLDRRLDRLRAVPGRTVAAPRPPPTHAAELADALGGQVLNTSAGQIVEIRFEQQLAVDMTALRGLPFAMPDDQPLVCLDLETTGLATAAGTLAFLVGLGWWSGDRFTVAQLLLPDHSDEHALLDALAGMLPLDAWLVTYNGRCFDWPLTVARYRLHRRAPPDLAGHLDLLPVARRLWKHRLGSARLAVVEEALCGVRREADLPGSLAPERYFAYLRSRQPDLLKEVVDHNRQDIVSLGLIVALLATLATSTESVQHPGDLLGLARAYRRHGQLNEALACTESALFGRAWDTPRAGAALTHRQLNAERARLLARLGRRQEALQAWLEICARGGPGAAVAWLHVARHREHFERDVSGALAACQQAAGIAERARLWGAPMQAVEADLARRSARLRRRLLRHRPVAAAVERAA